MEPFTFFISYRRRDTAPFALLLKYELERRLQFVKIELDIESINAGDKFPDRLQNMIRNAHATIVLIGKNWMPDHSDEKDWVVEELIHSGYEFNNEMEKNSYELPKRMIVPLFIECSPNFNQFKMPDSIGYIKTLQSLSIDYAGWPLQIGAVISTIAKNSKINERLEKNTQPDPSPSKARTQSIETDELKKILAFDDYSGWSIDNFGNNIERYLIKNFKFKDFNEAKAFMSKVSDYCSDIGHHPDWRNVYDTVTVSLSTWDARNRITIFDLNLALYMNKVAASVKKT